MRGDDSGNGKVGRDVGKLEESVVAGDQSGREDKTTIRFQCQITMDNYGHRCSWKLRGHLSSFNLLSTKSGLSTAESLFPSLGKGSSGDGSGDDGKDSDGDDGNGGGGRGDGGSGRDSDGGGGADSADGNVEGGGRGGSHGDRGEDCGGDEAKWWRWLGW